MKSEKITFAHSALKLFLTLLLLCAVFALTRWITPHAQAASYTISSVEQMTEYAIAYRDNTTYESGNGVTSPSDVLTISLSSGDAITDNTFVGLGTESRPFAGTIVVPTGGIDTFSLFHRPLFNYVTTDLKITGAGVIKIDRRAAALPDGSLGALFADHVIAGSGNAAWSVYLAGTSNDSSFAGLIGDITANGKTVAITFENNANVNISGSGNVGYICGTLNANVTLEVTTAGSGSALSVTSTGGSAGGLVGKMESGSTLKFNSANNTRVTSVTSDTGYAGGIVGYADRVNIAWKAGVTDYTVSGSVTGATAAGGLFGYYKNNTNNFVFTMENTYAVTAGMEIASTQYAGGVFGRLDNTAAKFTFNGNNDGTLSHAEVIRVDLSGKEGYTGTARGGVCGIYRTNYLTNTFEITDTKTQIKANTAATTDAKAGPYAAGLIGAITNTAAYLSIHDVSCASYSSSTGHCPDAGLIGTVYAGTFVDLSGTITITDRFNAGLICNFPSGVLRIAGLTDLSGYRQWNDTSNWMSATIVKDRDRTLIYALGTGKNYNAGTGTGWTLKRNNDALTASTIDDIHTWGEVVRIDGTNLMESNLVTVDMTAHTVTVAEPVAAMTGLTDFVKTALNIKLGVAAAGVGALQFERNNQSATLLSGTLSISVDIDLTGTGILGLTRDNGTNGAFTGTFNGNGHTITLAIGEVYGVDGNGTALTSANSTQGVIRRHLYHGLFAKTGSGAAFNYLTINGSITVIQDVTDFCIGGIAAQATGSLTLSDVTVDDDLELDFTINADYATYIGGAVGLATGNVAVTVNETTADRSTFKPTATDNTPTGKDRTKTTYVGGVIGYIDATGTTQSVSITGVTIGINYTKSTNTTRESCFGSAIAGIANKAYVKNNRTVTLDTVTVDLEATGTAANKRFGGILGTDWYSVDVTITALTVDAAITATGTADFGGLVQSATGGWNIQSLWLGAVTYSVTKAGSTFGFVANKTHNAASGANTALYLAIDNTDDAETSVNNYDITGLTFSGSGTFDVYDEIVAYSRFGTRNIASNGHSVISITTSGNVITTTGASYNTYLNKTDYGKDNHCINPNTRYYYNIPYACTQAASVAKYNFLVWTVKEYALSSLSAWFSATATFSGDLDMTGLSYYPVDLADSVTFQNATLKLDNNTMESSVNHTDASATTRTTRSATNQHYLMHTAVFRNVTANITVTKTTVGLKLQGNVPKIDNAFCGFLVAGTLGGTDNVDPTLFTAADMICDGVYISNAGNYYTTSSGDFYAPLLINKIGKNITLTITGAKQTSNYSAFPTNNRFAASSLIGDVGSDTARAISLTFTGMIFDGYKTGDSGMSSFYGTTHTVFKRATLLNSFRYLGESSGSYNFVIGEDWDTSTGDPKHEVTYGQEIVTSVENASKQEKYHASAYYVSPTTYEENSGPYDDFGDDYLPYVYTAYDLATKYHELSINVSYSSVIEGYGKYDKPFKIDSGHKLFLISEMINGTSVGTTVQIQLPGDLTDYNYTATGYGEATYKFGNTNFTLASDDSTAFATTAVRQYLAGAYYLIDGIDPEDAAHHIDITLPSDYKGLGTSITGAAEYAFRGVLIGGSSGTKTIVNTSDSPLIKSSNGAVIKDLTIEVAVDKNGSNVIEMTVPATGTAYSYGAGLHAYGAVIAQIMGGDTIIDNVQVTFTDVAFTWSSSDNNKRLNPIGGYVGVIVNGGLIFRNMTGTYNGLTASTLSAVSNAGYLYVNPFIGRVLAGYAFNETASTYNIASTKLNNGDKNYNIPDLSLSLAGSAPLDVTNASSQFTIDVKNGQAMYVLGAIVNSGAAAASYSSSADQAYADLADFWQAYRLYTTVRGGSYYTTVGTATGDDYTNANTKDQYYSYVVVDAAQVLKAQVPYIVRAYTAQKGSVYPARCLGRRTNNILSISADLTSTGAGEVPKGFKGLGSIYLDHDYLRLAIAALKGGNHTVTLNMRFYEYGEASEKYKANSANSFTTSMESMSFYSNAGFGLFNRLVFTGDGSNDNNTIKNLTLAGTVYYDIYNISGSLMSAAWNSVNKSYVLNVGGLAGVVYPTTASHTPLKITNVTLDGLTLQGPKYAGGLAGLLYDQRTDTKINTITQCGSTAANGANVTAGKAAGGLFGYVGLNFSDKAACNKLVITGGTGSERTTLYKLTITVSGPLDVEKERLSPAVGGLIGCCDVSYNSANFSVAIDHMCVSGGTLSFSVSGATSTGGGIIGKIRGFSFSVTDTDVKKTAVSSGHAGGLIGYTINPRNSPKVAFDNLLIDGQIAVGNNAAITAVQNAGGLIGYYFAKNTTTPEFSDIKICNYTIASTGTTNTVGAAGGFIGAINTSTKDANAQTIYMHDIEIDACALSAAYTSDAETDASCMKGVGGFFGATYGHTSNKNTYLYGYNILIRGTSLAGTATVNFGSVVGNNVSGRGTIIKLVGVSNGVTSEKTLGWTENNNGGYVVFADYAGKSTHTTHAGVDDSTTSADNYNNQNAASPYATVNPFVTAGGQTFTGDGAASTVGGLAINAILDGGTTGRYAYAAQQVYDLYDDTAGDTNYKSFNGSKGKLVLFSSEATGYSGADFAVLVLDSTDTTVSNKLILSYLRLLTNTRFDFTDDTDNRFKVVVYNLSATNNVFSVRTTGASLQLDTTNGFHMLNTAVDSGKAQFSLIDIRFYDPKTPSKVAYHLYVPVFVRKVLSYQFDIAVQSGTTYLESNYTSIYGQQLIENVGTPVTFYFKYTYTRAAEDWIEAINVLGEKADRNYVKKLLFRDTNPGITSDFTADTILVLVDRQTNTPYYAKLGDFLDGSGNLINDTIDLSQFRATMTKEGGVLTFGGAYFTPVNLSELMTLSVTSGGTMVECNADDPNILVTVSGQGYRLATQDELDNEGTEKWTVSVTAMRTESYYLSVFTQMTEDYDRFHYYIVTAPSAFSENDYPSKISDTGTHTMLHLIMGKIFEHGEMSVTSTSPNGSSLMTNTNNSLTVTMSVQLALSGDLGSVTDDMKTKMERATVYQSFMVYLKRIAGNSVANAIIGDPTSETHTYNVDYTLNGSADTGTVTYGSSGSTYDITQNYAAFVTSNLGTYFATGDTFEVNATITLNYSAAAIPSQFPGKSSESSPDGVTVSATSSLAFLQSAAASSKNSIKEDDRSERTYYSLSDPDVATLSLNQYSDTKGDVTALGINARNITGTSAEIELLAILNTTSVTSYIEGYTDAVVTVTLAAKQSDGSYGSNLPISTYITALSVGGVSATDSGTYYSTTVARANLTDSGAYIQLPTITLTVKTGNALESDDLMYGNYRVTVSVQLRRSGSGITESQASNYVIYTNAKVLPDFAE